MAVIPIKERDFWMNYFRGQVQAAIKLYKADNAQFLTIDLQEQAEVQANRALGITGLIESYTEADREIRNKQDAFNSKQNAAQKAHDKLMEPLERKRDKLYARRKAKVMGGKFQDYMPGVRYDNNPYTYDTLVSKAQREAQVNILSASTVGKHIAKLEQQRVDVPVALMLASSRHEMGVAVRHLADAIGVMLPVTQQLENLTS